MTIAPATDALVRNDLRLIPKTSLGSAEMDDFLMVCFMGESAFFAFFGNRKFLTTVRKPATAGCTSFSDLPDGHRLSLRTGRHRTRRLMRRSGRIEHLCGGLRLWHSLKEFGTARVGSKIPKNQFRSWGREPFGQEKIDATQEETADAGQ